MQYLLLILGSLFFTSVSAQKIGDITVQIPEISKAGQGKIYVSLFDENGDFPNTASDAIAFKVIEHFDATAACTFEQIPHGNYAIALFQDINGNKELDKNFFGFPKEPVGTSNLNTFSRPTFSKCKFEMTSDTKTVVVRFMND